jgi:prolyl oligopeptidase
VGLRRRVTEDGRYLIINVWEGSADKNRVFYQDLKPGVGKGKVVELLNNFDAQYGFVGNDGPVFYFQANKDAPRGKLIAIDTRKPDASDAATWTTLVPEAPETLRGVSHVGGQFLLNYLKDAHSQVKQYDRKGKLVREVALPGIGSAYGFGGEKTDKDTFFVYTSYTTPATIYRHDIASGKSEVYRQPKVDFDPTQYETSQVFYRSKDGTQVPMFLTHKKGLQRRTAEPDLPVRLRRLQHRPDAVVLGRRPDVDGDGRRARGRQPARRRRVRPRVARGRHQAAQAERVRRLHRRGRVPDRREVHEPRQARDRRAQQRRPARRRRDHPAPRPVRRRAPRRRRDGHAALPQVHDRLGVGPRLRLRRRPERVQGAARLLAAAQPQGRHEVPATLVHTADHDDRVVPGHSYKFAAAMQAAQGGDKPVLIRVEVKAGHGAGKPTSKQIEEWVDLWGFLVKNLGMKVG